MHVPSTEIIIVVISSCVESAHFFEAPWFLAVVLTWPALNFQGPHDATVDQPQPGSAWHTTCVEISKLLHSSNYLVKKGLLEHVSTYLVQKGLLEHVHNYHIWELPFHTY
jgi:hypothetical protein